MIIGIPTESKVDERRVALLPAAVGILVADGHEVRVQAGAGAGVGQGDAAYRGAGATIVEARSAWDVPLVVKVKEVQPQDFPHVRAGSAVFSFHHLPGEPERTRELADRGISAVAFEMVREADGSYPLLAPMSVIAGRLAFEAAVRHATVPVRRVLVLGGGHAGRAAAHAARAAGVEAIVLTRSQGTREAVAREGLVARLSTPAAVEREALRADAVVGAVFIPAEPTPKLLTRLIVRRMRPGSIIVDVSIDAGGVAETSRPTTLTDPVFVEEGVVHYAVPNMPASVPAEAAAAISRAVLPYVRQLAGRGIEVALREDPALAAGVLIWRGRVAHAGIADEAGVPFVPFAAHHRALAS